MRAGRVLIFSSFPGEVKFNGKNWSEPPRKSFLKKVRPEAGRQEILGFYLFKPLLELRFIPQNLIYNILLVMPRFHTDPNSLLEPFMQGMVDDDPHGSAVRTQWTPHGIGDLISSS